MGKWVAAWNSCIGGAIGSAILSSDVWTWPGMDRTIKRLKGVE